MIGLRDSLTLARTKVRSKRIRLLITTIVSGLLFGLIAGGVLLVDGTRASIDRFADQNFGGRYLVQANPAFSTMNIYPDPMDPEVRDEVTALHTAYIAERKAAAKKYGITDYDEKDEQQPVIAMDMGDPSIPASQRLGANPESVAWKRREAAEIAKLTQGSKNTYSDFQSVVRAAGATQTYEPRSLQNLGLTYLKDGVEDLSRATAGNDQENPQQDSSITGSNFTLLDDDLVKTFIAEPNAARSTPKGVPVLVPVDDIANTLGTSLGLTKRPKDGSAQLDWYRDVRSKANGVTFTSCYRNQAELTRIDDARRITAEIAAGKSKAGYVPPELVLALPTSPCGAVTVVSDKRTDKEKTQEANQKAFDALANPAAAPEESARAELVTFQIVGVLPTGQAGSNGLESMIASIVGTNYGYGAIIPRELLSQLPADLQHSALFSKESIQSIDSLMGYGPMGPQAAYLASFPTVDGARAYLKTTECDFGGGLFDGGFYGECGKPFTASTYGTSYLVVDEFSTAVRPYLIGLLAALFGVATIIIWAMMGRVIADSRRETAVFRAIGAKRTDIIKVYLLYSVWVAVRIAVFAAVLAGLIALAVELIYTQRATNAAKLAYGTFDGEATFHFIGVPSLLWWSILGGILVMALIAITPPLLRNIRRNPIKDMRDE